MIHTHTHTISEQKIYILHTWWRWHVVEMDRGELEMEEEACMSSHHHMPMNGALEESHPPYSIRRYTSPYPHQVAYTPTPLSHLHTPPSGSFKREMFLHCFVEMQNVFQQLGISNILYTRCRIFVSFSLEIRFENMSWSFLTTVSIFYSLNKYINNIAYAPHTSEFNFRTLYCNANTHILVAWAVCRKVASSFE